MTDAQFQKVSDLLRDGRMEEAQVAVSSLQASDPEDVRVWLLEATVCEARGDLDSVSKRRRRVKAHYCQGRRASCRQKKQAAAPLRCDSLHMI